MIYRVTAHLKSERAAEYLIKLTVGMIKSQRADGGDIVDALNCAVVTVTVGTGIRKLSGWVNFGRR